jgi:hypothetical protein
MQIKKEAVFMEQLLVGIFCDIDEFCKAFEAYWQQHLVTDGRAIIPKCNMSLSEIMTIVIFFHLSNQRTFKWYYINFICGHMKHCFPKRLRACSMSFCRQIYELIFRH